MTTLPARTAALAVTALLAVAIAAGAAGPEGAPSAPSAQTAPSAQPAAAQPAPQEPARVPQPPVHISADSAEYFNAENLVVFTGKVVAVQADTTITAERMEVHFTPAGGAGEQTPAGAAEPVAAGTGPGAGQRIASITAIQSVTFRQVDAQSGKERYATGEQGVYDADKRIVTLTGAPRLWEGKNVIVGERMDFYLDDKKVVVKGKVNLTIYPDEAPKGAGGNAPR